MPFLLRGDRRYNAGMSGSIHDPHHLRAPGRFATTQWSLVVTAGRTDPAAEAALETLCRTYWYPLYAYVRRKGCPAEDASDLIQEFFAYILEKHTIAVADRERGRFRTFLLTVLQRFLATQRERAGAQKRAGGRKQLGLDVSSGEDRYVRERYHELTPERIYERRWALLLLENVLHRLEQDYTSRGQAPPFDRLRNCLAGRQTGPSYAELAAEVDLSESAIKVAVRCPGA